MSYQSFEDFYRDAEIKHLVLFEHDGKLVSPPFCTDKCKDYSRVMIVENSLTTFVEVDTQPATSKYNTMANINGTLYFAPYGIWDNFNTLLSLNNLEPRSYKIISNSKGQFYNMASNGNTGFASPLGYDPVSFAIYIKDWKIQQIEIPGTSELKRHMGTVFCNGSYFSPPRGESYDYNSILKFKVETDQLTLIPVPNLVRARRKYSDFIVAGNKLFALPFGRDLELKHVLVYDTVNETSDLVELDIPDFVKKYNGGVLVDDTIIALPYGHKDNGDANYGLIFNVDTYKHSTFDIGLSFGGKYRFRSGIAFNNTAVFLPAGSPNADIIVVDKLGNIKFRKQMQEYILGRPIVYNSKIVSMAYKIQTKEHFLFTLDADYTTTLSKIDIT
jgi:hypothetical protein